MHNNVMTSILKNIIVIAGLLAIAGIGYYLFVVERSATVASSGQSIDVVVAAETEGFLRRLRDLQEISLSREIFSDARFQSLRDFGSPIDRVSFGRSEPFTTNDSPVSAQTVSQ